MHIDIVDDLNMIIYLQNDRIKNIDFSDKSDLQDYFKDLFVNLKNNYNININGYYYINVYKDKYYGCILEMKKEELDYMEYLDGQVDMNIVIDTNDTFLYEMNDYFNIDKSLINNVNVYKYNNKIYVKLVNNISNIKMGQLLEFSNIIYGDKCKKIRKMGNLIEMEKIHI